MFFTVFVSVLASTVISEVTSDPCADLVQCRNNFDYGVNGTWSWAMLQCRPNRSEYRAIWQGMCNSREVRQTCITNSTCTDQTILRKANLSRRKARKLCRPLGRRFFRRIRNSECIGNASLFGEVVQYQASCMANHGLTYSTFRGNCIDALAARECTRTFLAERCGDLFKWMIDQMWHLRFKVFFPNCDPPPRTPFPRRNQTSSPIEK